jgi:hypothetical protein
MTMRGMRKKKRVNTSRVTVRTAFVVSLLALLVFVHSSVAVYGKDDGKDKDLKKHFGVIFGTAWAPDDRPVYGAKIQIHPVGQKRPHWQVVTDQHGEFAQPVPPGPADFVVSGEAEVVRLLDGKAQKKIKIKGERTVHVYGEERQDISLRLEE